MPPSYKFGSGRLRRLLIAISYQTAQKLHFKYSVSRFRVSGNPCRDNSVVGILASCRIGWVTMTSTVLRKPRTSPAWKVGETVDTHLVSCPSFYSECYPLIVILPNDIATYPRPFTGRGLFDSSRSKYSSPCNWWIEVETLTVCWSTKELVLNMWSSWS
jgi:hypothetical protein